MVEGAKLAVGCGGNRGRYGGLAHVNKLARVAENAKHGGGEEKSVVATRKMSLAHAPCTASPPTRAVREATCNFYAMCYW